MKAVALVACMQVACLVGLSGCTSPVYDREAVPSAISAQRLATDLCDARAREQLIKSMTEWVDCYLRAHKQTADAIKLSKPELYQNYAMRAQLLAWQFDQRAIGVDEFGAKFAQATDEYYDAVLSASEIQQERKARQAAALRAFGASLQQAGAAVDGRNPRR